MVRFLICLLFALYFTVANAATNCYEVAGKLYNIDPTLIYSIAEQESSFNPSALNKSNSNKSIDYGLMQVNSFWIPHIKKFGAKKEDLFDPCYNIYVGTWILAKKFKRGGYTWNSVGAYNAGFGKSELRQNLRNKYANKVRLKYERNCKKFGCFGNLYWNNINGNDNRLYK